MILMLLLADAVLMEILRMQLLVSAVFLISMTDKQQQEIGAVGLVKNC